MTDTVEKPEDAGEERHRAFEEWAEALRTSRTLAEGLELDGSSIDRIADLGRRANSIEIESIFDPGLDGVPEEIPVAIVRGEKPEIQSVAHLFEAYRTHPSAKKGTAKVLTLDSFMMLTKRHSTEHSAVFADTNWRSPSFTAVIDYHQLDNDGRPDNGKHRVHYDFPLSDAWTLWTSQDSKPMDQQDFAAFLEDHIADLSSPLDEERAHLESTFATKVATPAELIQLSRGLQVNVEAKVASAVTLQSGEGKIVFEESHRDAAGQPISVPGLFILQVEPFFMGERVRIPCRLRYRVKGGTLAWSFALYRPDQHVTDRVRADLDIVRNETGLPCFEGAPEMAG